MFGTAGNLKFESPRDQLMYDNGFLVLESETAYEFTQHMGGYMYVLRKRGTDQWSVWQGKWSMNDKSPQPYKQEIKIKHQTFERASQFAMRSAQWWKENRRK